MAQRYDITSALPNLGEVAPYSPFYDELDRLPPTERKNGYLTGSLRGSVTEPRPVR